jgi:membrane associated rhomboid family serine protease
MLEGEGWEIKEKPKFDGYTGKPLNESARAIRVREQQEEATQQRQLQRQESQRLQKEAERLQQERDNARLQQEREDAASETVMQKALQASWRASLLADPDDVSDDEVDGETLLLGQGFDSPRSGNGNSLYASLLGSPRSGNENSLYRYGGTVAAIPRRLMRRARHSMRSFMETKKKHEAHFLHFICLVCTVVFLWQMGEANWEFAGSEENPMLGPSARSMVYAGGQVTGCMINQGQWWRLISTQFLHAGFVHLIGNLVTLLILGKHLEESFGWLPVAVIYLSSGFAGALSTAIWLPDSVGVGASGAILGLHGAEWSDLIMNWWSDEEERKERVWMLSIMTFTIVLSGLFPFVNFFAHFSGLVCGMLLGLCLVVRKRYSRDGALREWDASQKWWAAGGLAASFLMIAIQLGIILGANSVNDLCANYVDCHPSYLCITTPWWPCSAADDIVCGYSWENDIVTVMECLSGEIKNATSQIRYDDTPALAIMCENVCGWYCAHPGDPSA